MQPPEQQLYREPMPLLLERVESETIRGHFAKEIVLGGAYTSVAGRIISSRPLQQMPVCALALTSPVPSRPRALPISRQGADFFHQWWECGLGDKPQ
jgi:hypothetical protein